ncbi:MAG TPA: alpha/beta fold hydrolase [Gemmatimonadaceae bacterium]|nr:MAG: hypothetical protein DMF56_24985 [Acidobacteriota bacterium]HTD83797.1 alpha/beta fold hydrolase [Gemmatimonadaceae bacterium]
MNTIDFLIAHQAIFLSVAAAYMALFAVGLRLHLSVVSDEFRFDLPGLFRRLSVGRKVVLIAAGVTLTTSVGSLVTGRGLIPKTLGLKLPPIQAAAQPTRKLLVFIHGWNGDEAETWQKFPTLARHDQRLAQFDIWAIDYPTYMFRRNVGISNLASFFDDQFANVYGIYERYDSIVIVAHSMGGLLSRKLLIHRAIAGASNTKYVAIIEIASPHAGAKPAALARALGVSRGFTDEMKSGSTFLNDLRDDWRRLSGRPPTFCLGSIHDGVVSAESALAECDGGFPYHVAYGHTALVKPDDDADPRYTTPVAHIPGLSRLPVPVLSQ